MHRMAVLAIGAALALGIGACGDDEDEENGPATYQPTQTETTADQAGEIQLDALNDSGVSGSANIDPQNGQVQVSLEATGTTPDQEHLAHIHVPEDGQEGTCPTEDADQDGDGQISLEEGAPAYGPVAVEFSPSPQADAEGNLNYDETLDAQDLDLERGVVVVHGAEVEGEYQPPLPVACGTID